MDTTLVSIAQGLPQSPLQWMVAGFTLMFAVGVSCYQARNGRTRR